MTRGAESVINYIIKGTAKFVVGQRVRMWMCKIIFWISTIFRRQGTVILLYHSISPSSDIRIPIDNKVNPDNFEEQMRYIAGKKKVISLATFLDYTKNRDKRLKDSIVITFDDGYLDNYELALPILKKYGLPATFFIATGLIDRTSIYDKLNYLVMTARKDRAVIPMGDASSEEISLTSGKNKHAFVNKAACLLENMSCEEQSDFLRSILAELHGDSFDIEQCNPKTMMSWEDCKIMSTYSNVSFGTHTVSHANLARLSTDAVQYEIMHSKKVLEAYIERPASFFSYSHGKGVNSYVTEVLKQNGFQCALTSNVGVNDSNIELFRLKRIVAPNESGLLFRFELLGYKGILKKIFSYIYVYSHDAV